MKENDSETPAQRNKGPSKISKEQMQLVEKMRK
jgi:hypothetical protein